MLQLIGIIAVIWLASKVVDLIMANMIKRNPKWKKSYKRFQDSDGKHI